MTSASTLPKYRQRTHELCGELLSLAHTLGPEGRFPSVAELASRFGASTATLGDALGELERQGVVQRVRGVGVFVAPPQQTAIALICHSRFFRGSTHSPFYDLLVNEAEERAISHQELFSCHFTLPLAQNEQPILSRELTEDIAAKRIQGVLGIGLPASAIQWIEEQGVPVVGYATTSGWRVHIRHESVVRQGVRFLAQRGCRSLAFWSHIPDRFPVPATLRAEIAHNLQVFEREVAAAGLETRPQWIETYLELTPREGDQAQISLQEQGYQAAQAMFGGDGEKPEGVVITNDVMAHGALAAFRHLGVEPGRDVLLVSHANAGSPMLMGTEQELTRVEVNPQDVVQKMFKMLETLLRGDVPPHQIEWVEPVLKMGSPL